MIKKTLSAIMAFACFISPLSSTAFASGKSKIPTRTVANIRRTYFEYQTMRAERIVYQKAFLAALLCTTGTDVYISNWKLNTRDFMVTKIGDLNFDEKIYRTNPAQLNFLLNYLVNNKKDNLDFKANLNRRNATILCAKINNCFLPESTIYKIGTKALDLINETKKKGNVFSDSSSLYLNLTENTYLRQQMMELLGDALKSSDDGSNALSIFTLYSEFNFKKLDPIENPEHIKNLKECSKEYYNMLECYETAFFFGFLASQGINVRVKFSKDQIVDPIFLSEINGIPIPHISKIREYTKILMKYTANIFPAKKLKIESINLYYAIPTKIVINNDIILYENDILVLGQRFHNAVYKDIANSIQTYIPYRIVDLQKFPNLGQTMKEIFKDYTGQDLPKLN